MTQDPSGQSGQAPPPPDQAPPPPQQGWQSSPQQPAAPAPSGPAGGGMPSWTSNITAQGTIPGPGGVALADTPNRIIAVIIDFVILGVIGFIVSFVLGSVLTETRTDLIFGVPVVTRGPSIIAGLLTAVVLLGISAAYFIYMWSRMGGATVGMKMLKLSVRDANTGGQITQGQAINRWLLLGGPQAAAFLFVIPVLGWLIWLGVIVYYIYLLVTVAQSPTRQGLHDKYAKTVVAKG